MLGEIAVADLSSSALLGVVVLLILMGRLVPRAILKDKAAESDRWREAYENEHAARLASDKQTGELLEVAKTTHGIIKAMAETSDRMRRSGGSDAIRET